MKRTARILILILIASALHAAAVYGEPGIVSIPEEEMVFGNADDLPTPAQAAEIGVTLLPYNDPNYNLQWGTIMVKTEKAYLNHLYGKEVKIAIIDSGSPAAHEDIGSNIVLETDYTQTGVNDEMGHSTFITGIIAADTNNDLGISGILPEVSIYSLKTLKKDGRGSTTNIAKAVRDSIDLYGCDVINMSLTTPSNDKNLQSAIEYAVENGAIIVAASGNKDSTENGTEMLYPAAYDGVIGVGAITRTKSHAYFSHYNASVDTCAPGDTVYSSKITEGYGTGRGTSYATPYVTAAAAIAKYINPEINYDGFMEILKNTCDPLGGAAQGERNDEYGYGMININRIIDYMSPPKLITASGAVISGVKLTADSEGGRMLTMSLANISKTPVSGSLYICGFDGEDNLISSKILNGVTAEPDAAEPITADLKNDFGSKLKIMYWDENLSPLTPPYQTVIKSE